MAAAPSHHHLQEPSAWVRRFAPLVPPGGTVLDVACGGGRHARLFLERGHPVVAVDRDVSQVRDLAEQAEVIEADLEDGSPWPLEARRFAAVVVTNYLYRPLFPVLLGSIADGGVLIYETFARGNEHYSRPRNPDHLLETGELLEVVKGHLQVVAFEQGLTARPSVVQRLCAVRRDDPAPLP